MHINATWVFEHMFPLEIYDLGPVQKRIIIVLTQKYEVTIDQYNFDDSHGY